MTHEIKQLFKTAQLWQNAGNKIALATVVALEGSSYRRPGVRMLLKEDGEMKGAVSGGCVEKEVFRQAKSVFNDGKPKMMTYDGRLRLGCEGIIHILLEPFNITETQFEAFESTLNNRKRFTCESFYAKEVGVNEAMGSQINLNGKSYPFRSSFQTDTIKELDQFSQEFFPPFQLYIFGAEYDAVNLCKTASDLGWEVTVVADPDESKTIAYFSGVKQLITPAYEQLDTSKIDKQTAVMVMTHSFNKDVQYLMALRNTFPAYFGLLGPKHRRERLLDKLLEYYPETSLGFLDQLHGPARINLGAEKASEIAISIVAEILSVVKKQEPIALREKTGGIHE